MLTLTFFSNFLNHHQKPLADQLALLLGTGFHFVSTTPIPEEFLRSGYENYEEVDYNVCTFRSHWEMEKALALGQNSDVVIFGSIDWHFVLDRIKANRLTFYYSEHLFRSSKWRKLNPRVVFYMLRYHTRFRNKNLHLLCTSGFISDEMKCFFAYPSKKYKWGYFTKVNQFPIDEVIIRKNSGTKLKLLWVGRFITCKHPQLAVELAELLKLDGILFELTMIGSGEKKSEITTMISNKDLGSEIVLAGNMTNNKVTKNMKESHILLCTSDHKEGWCAVINEALSNGCVVVAGNKIGSVPYLIKDGITGFTFESKKLHSLYSIVSFLIGQKELRKTVAIEAYNQMKNYWSPEIAATNIIRLSKTLISGRPNDIIAGPCSNAGA